MANLPSEQDKKDICADLIDLITQYDTDRDKVIAQVEEDKLVSRPDEMPLTRTKKPETSEEAYRNAKVDIQALRGRRQIHPIDSSHIMQVFGSQPDGGRTAYTESFKQEVRKAATDKKLNWAEQEFTREPGVLRLKGRNVSYKLAREQVSWYEELSDKPEDKLDNLELLQGYITKGILNQFGGFERVTDIIISGGQLIINKFMYVPVIPPEYTSRLPLDTADYITSGCIAGLFNYNSLRQMKRLYSFYCDDLEFYTLNIADDLGLGRRIGVSSLFEVCPNLMELTIGDETLMRKDLYRDESKQMKEKVRRQNLFHRLTDSYKFNICAGTDSFQSYAFSNLKNYATNRGDKGIFRFCLGTTARTTIAAGATALNLFAQVGREIMVMLKEST